MTIRVFFSHSTKDFSWIEPIVAQVNAMGLKGYVYEHDSQPGRPVAPKIKSAITRSQVFVAFLTMNSHDAPYVQQEIGYAQDKGKLIVPFVEQGVPERSIAMLQGIERIEFNPQNLQDAINKLWAYLARHAMQLLGLDDYAEYDEALSLPDLAPDLDQPASRITPPLLTMSVNMHIDRDTALALLGIALAVALAGVVAYVIIQNAHATGGSASPPTA